MAGEMNLISSSFSCSGPGHDNEDAVMEGLKLDDGFALAIADGIGGRPGGAIASKLAIESLKDLLQENLKISLPEIFDKIKKIIINKGSISPNLSQMGTTLSVCILSAGRAAIGHVGDTRIYHLRGEGIMDRTKDQTEVQQLIDEGILSKARAKRYQRRHVLISAIGADTSMNVYENSFSVELGDRIVLVSDGVYDLVPRRVVRDLSLKSKSPKSLAIALRKSVERHGASDDYSAVCAEITKKL